MTCGRPQALLSVISARSLRRAARGDQHHAPAGPGRSLVTVTVTAPVPSPGLAAGARSLNSYHPGMARTYDHETDCWGIENELGAINNAMTCPAYMILRILSKVFHFVAASSLRNFI